VSAASDRFGIWSPGSPFGVMMAAALASTMLLFLVN
jgi:hypothetical protein